MPRDSRQYLEDIVEAIGRIHSYVAGMDESSFARDTKTQDAVLRNLEVIGEAVGRLPDTIDASAPEVEWRKIRALRNILVHEYFGINLPIVWDVIQNKLAPVETACRRLLAG
jgi:uncharacterized protein with HEPN domain